MLLYLWDMLCLPLSLKKAARGKKITWTSATFSLTASNVKVGLKPELVLPAAQLELRAKLLGSRPAHHAEDGATGLADAHQTGAEQGAEDLPRNVAHKATG